MFYLYNKKLDVYAREDSIGEHDDKHTLILANAASFETWGEASDYSQNFGADWYVEEF